MPVSLGPRDHPKARGAEGDSPDCRPALGSSLFCHQPLRCQQADCRAIPTVHKTMSKLLPWVAWIPGSFSTYPSCPLSPFATLCPHQPDKASFHPRRHHSHPSLQPIHPAPFTLAWGHFLTDSHIPCLSPRLLFPPRTRTAEHVETTALVPVQVPRTLAAHTGERNHERDTTRSGRQGDAPPVHPSHLCGNDLGKATVWPESHLLGVLPMADQAHTGPAAQREKVAPPLAGLH